jgi:hypothetical protein
MEESHDEKQKEEAIETIFSYPIRKKDKITSFQCTFVFVHLSIADEHV